MAARLDRAAELIATTGGWWRSPGRVSRRSRGSRTSGARQASGRDTIPTTSRSRTSCARRTPAGGTGRSGASCTPRSARRSQTRPTGRSSRWSDWISSFRHHAERRQPPPASGNGSRTKVIELHGNATRVRCLGCDTRYARDEIQARLLTGESVPTCGDAAGFSSRSPSCSVSRCRARRSARRGAGQDRRVLPGGGLVARRLPGGVHAELREGGGRSPAGGQSHTDATGPRRRRRTGRGGRHDARRTGGTSRGPGHPLRQGSEGCGAPRGRRGRSGPCER